MENLAGGSEISSRNKTPADVGVPHKYACWIIIKKYSELECFDEVAEQIENDIFLRQFFYGYQIKVRRGTASAKARIARSKIDTIVMVRGPCRITS
jgi:hypothetical protein